MGEVNYWNEKLEKIEFAIETLKEIKVGENIDERLANLEAARNVVMNNIVEAIKDLRRED